MYERFLELCKLRGLSINQACDLMLIAPSSISMWKTRGSMPRAEQLIRIADYFGVTTDYLLGRSSEMIEKGSLNKTEQFILNRIRLLDLKDLSHLNAIIELLIKTHEERMKPEFQDLFQKDFLDENS